MIGPPADPPNCSRSAGVTCPVKWLACIGGRGIASKGVGGAVQAVGARLDPNVYDRAVPEAVFRLGILLGTEFLNGIDGHAGTGISALIHLI